MPTKGENKAQDRRAQRRALKEYPGDHIGMKVRKLGYGRGMTRSQLRNEAREERLANPDFTRTRAELDEYYRTAEERDMMLDVAQNDHEVQMWDIAVTAAVAQVRDAFLADTADRNTESQVRNMDIYNIESILDQCGYPASDEVLVLIRRAGFNFHFYGSR